MFWQTNPTLGNKERKEYHESGVTTATNLVTHARLAGKSMGNQKLGRARNQARK
jgi:hypothetical protein